ncbi:hypothetical protein ACRWZ7_10125, partial [Escherichia coli]
MNMIKDAFQFGIEPVRITDTDNLQINEGLPTNADPQVYALQLAKTVKAMLNGVLKSAQENIPFPVEVLPTRNSLPTPIIALNRPGFPGECFICELRLPDHRFRWKHNKLFLLL